MNLVIVLDGLKRSYNIGKIEPDGLSYSTPVVIDKEFKFSIDDKEVRFNLHCE
jgi:hypothetical protein